MSLPKTVAATTLALCGFAANSLLCRAALASGRVDPCTFTAVRLASGAVVLAGLVALARVPRPLRRSGSWAAAVALLAYAIAFSLAYVRLAAGIGALLLFGAVQATMLGTAVVRGERLRARQWLGVVLALCGLAGLTLPGASAPAPLAAGLMLLAGVAWACYTLCGRGARHALAGTADNFVRAVPLALLPLALAWPLGATPPTVPGVLLAVTSGALASGVGYALWYAALRGLTTPQAALLQLLVPVLAAAGGIAFLGETPTQRLWLGGSAILAGVALALRRT